MIPLRTLEALGRYVNEGIPTGDFLYNVLTNQLFPAVAHADEGNLEALVEICRYIYNDVPGGCWGTPDKVRAWVALGGMAGLRRQAAQQQQEETPA